MVEWVELQFSLRSSIAWLGWQAVAVAVVTRRDSISTIHIDMKRSHTISYQVQCQNQVCIQPTDFADNIHLNLDSLGGNEFNRGPNLSWTCNNLKRSKWYKTLWRRRAFTATRNTCSSKVSLSMFRTWKMLSACRSSRRNTTSSNRRHLSMVCWCCFCRFNPNALLVGYSFGGFCVCDSRV